ncbi:cation transporter [uncultured Kriegella sp.]|uniref:heavy-metal-associated domain-containing protein n=1 Tax=uncultured Kriegella sp. TaxID=1798910 RepID=UPI0030D991FB|tara:strand:+ start:66633 stop:66905 length:273 start_codon:yes stop_codon:yes gene_type:complete
MKTSIIVQNLKGSACKKAIISKLSELPTISNITVDVDLARVSFVYENFNDALVVKEVLKAIGYPSIHYRSSTSKKTFSFTRGVALKLSKS